MKKLICCMIFLAVVSGACFAQSADDEVLYDAPKAFRRADLFLNQEKESQFASTCVGRWEFKNGNSVTAVELAPSGVALITQKKNLVLKIWRGEWTASENVISFTISDYEYQNGVSSTTQVMDSQWKINYELSGKVLTLTSRDLPADFDGYSFEKKTEFRKN